jgi:3,4-dihydroxy-2-butanone 4-phosphate synthase
MRRERTAISPIAEIIGDLRAGNIVILVDDEDRENEGDLVFAADFVTAEKVNFLARHGRGLICMPVTVEHASRLGLRPMVTENRSRHGTNFTASIEAAEGIATGISAQDRALTIKVAAAPDAKHSDIVQPGHVFPLIAEAGGVLVRAGHTEACCDLARLAWPDARGRAVRNHEGQRQHGAAAGPARIRRAARPAHWHDRRPDRVPQRERIDRPAHCRPGDRDCIWPVPHGRLPRYPGGRHACRAHVR